MERLHHRSQFDGSGWVRIANEGVDGWLSKSGSLFGVLSTIRQLGFRGPQKGTIILIAEHKGPGFQGPGSQLSLVSTSSVLLDLLVH